MEQYDPASAASTTTSASAEGEHKDSYEASTSGEWDKMFVPVNIEGRSEEIGDLAQTAEEQAAMEKSLLTDSQSNTSSPPICTWRAQLCRPSGQATKKLA